MIIKEFHGMPLTWIKITPGDTVTSIPAGAYYYKELEIGYDSGDYAFLEGNVIVGASSGAMGIVRSCTVTSGTVGGGNAAGKIRFHSWNGINFTNNEKIKVGADSDVGDIDGSAPAECADEYAYKEAVAMDILVCAQSNTQRIAFGYKKISTDQTSGLGLPLSNGSSILISDASAIKNFNVVDAVSGSAGSVIIVGSF